MKRLILLVFTFSFLSLSCGSRDLSKGAGDDVSPSPLSGLEPDRLFLQSKNIDFLDLLLRQVSSDFSSVFFTDIVINLSSGRVIFENESVGELSCQLEVDVNTCDLIFYEGITGPFALGFDDDYSLEVTFQPTEAFVFDNAPSDFGSAICDASFGSSVIGEKTSIKIFTKEDDGDTPEELVSFFFYDFGFENQGQLSPTLDSENTTLHYGVDFDQFFTGPFSFSGLRKNPADDVSYLEVQAIQANPSFKRSLVCFND